MPNVRFSLRSKSWLLSHMLVPEFRRVTLVVNDWPGVTVSGASIPMQVALSVVACAHTGTGAKAAVVNRRERKPKTAAVLRIDMRGKGPLIKWINIPLMTFSVYQSFIKIIVYPRD